MEPLESRQLLTAVSWDGEGDGTSWSDPINWSGNVLPGVADDVTINVVGTITVTHASGSTTIRSVNSDENLVISGGTLTVTNGASVINGAFTISTASLTVSGAGTTFTAAAAATIEQSSLFATTGAQLNLTSASSYAERPAATTFIRASGAGTKIDLSGVTSITGVSGTLQIDALNGGEVELDSLATITAAQNVDATSEGAGSVLDFAALTNWTDATILSSLNLRDGGVAEIPALATMTAGAITVSWQSTTFPMTLTNVNESSLTVSGDNSFMSLPGVTSWSKSTGDLNIFQSFGTNSKLDLSGITSITGNAGSLWVYAVSGGEVELDGLTTLTARDVEMVADGANSVLDLATLPSWTDTTSLSVLALVSGGAVQIPALTTMTAGAISVSDQSTTFPMTLTNVNGSSLVVSGDNSFMSLPGVTSWSELTGVTSTFLSSGINSKLDLSSITSITGNSGGLDIEALSGGEVELDGLTSINARDVDVSADVANSLVELSALTTWNDAAPLSLVAASNGGTVQLAASSTLSGVSMTPSSSGVISGGTIQFNSPGTVTGNGGTVQAAFVNNSSVSPGSTSPGRVTFVGGYTQTATATYTVQLNGLTPVTQYDQIAVQGTVSLGGTLTITRGFTPSIGDSFTIIDNDGADAVVGTFAGALEGEVYTINTIPLRLSYVGGDGNDVTLTRVANLNVRRLLFYNQSGTSGRYDSNDSAINAVDDLAIASDKAAYLPAAGPATFANVSSYTKGINGIMVDLAGPHGTLSLSDFEFRVGNNNSPSTWGTANLPTSMSVRAGAGYRGADRIEFVWTTGAPVKQWLEVITLANGTTNLPQKLGYPAGQGDVFFFGNAVGNSGLGDTAINATVNATDEIGARNNPANLAANIPITNIYDYDRNAQVNASDQIASRNNATNPTTVLKYLNLSSPPLAPQGDDGVEGAIASALVATSPAAEDITAAPASETAGGAASNSAPGEPAVARQLLHWARANTPRARAILAAVEAPFGLGDLDDELLAALAGRLFSGRL